MARGKKKTKVIAANAKEPLMVPLLEQLDKGMFEKPSKNAKVKSHRNLLSWPVDALYYRYQSIDKEQHNACVRFYSDFLKGGLIPKVSVQLVQHSGGRHEMSDSAAIAHANWCKAYRAIQGSTGQRLAVDIICGGWSASSLLKEPQGGAVQFFTRFERAKIYKNRDALVARFIEAVEDLVEHYHFRH